MKPYLPLSLFITVALTGCMETTNAGTPNPEAEFIQKETGVYISNGTFNNKQTKVIRDQQTYAAELTHYTNKAAETLDFNQGQVLLVDMGQRSSGGYAIAVSSIDVFDDYVMANVTLTKPGNNCMVTMALTNPYQFVYIPTRKEILVTESLQINNCPP